MAQIFAPPQFEFPENAPPISDATAYIPSEQAQGSVEILSMSESHDVEEGDTTPLRGQAGNGKDLPCDNVVEGMDIDPSSAQEKDIENAGEGL
jgi:hypothetical protein